MTFHTQNLATGLLGTAFLHAVVTARSETESLA